MCTKVTLFLCLMSWLPVSAQNSTGSFVEVYGQRIPKGDAVPINTQEAEVFGQTICADLVTEWGRCQYSVSSFGPFLYFDNGPGFYPVTVHYGSFTEIDAQEVLVGLALEGTDSGAMSHILLHRMGTEWQAVRFIEDALLQTYLKFPASDGHTLFVAREDRRLIGGRFESYMSGFTLQTVDISKADIKVSLLFDFANPVLSCTFPPAPGARYVKIISWARQDANEDGYLDLLIYLSETEFGEFVCSDRDELLEDPRLSESTIRQLAFFFDGQSFQPSLEAERLKQYSQREQGEASYR